MSLERILAKMKKTKNGLIFIKKIMIWVWISKDKFQKFLIQLTAKKSTASGHYTHFNQIWQRTCTFLEHCKENSFFSITGSFRCYHDRVDFNFCVCPFSNKKLPE